MSDPGFSYPYHHLVLSLFNILNFLLDNVGYLILPLIFISLMAKVFEHLFMCLFDIYTSSLEKYLFKSFAILKIELFVFLLMSCKSSLNILNTKPLSDIRFTNIFSHSMDCLFTLLIVSFNAHMF